MAVALSPITGWTRTEYLRVLDRQLHHCTDRMTGGQVRLPGRPSWSGPDSDGQEGFVRSFLGAAIRLVADPDDPTGLLSTYRTGLLDGADPASSTRWPSPVDRGQAIVETAGLALCLLWTKDMLFDELSGPDQRTIAAYVAQVPGKAVPNNNWHLFTVLAEEFLIQCDPSASAATRRMWDEDIDERLALVDSWYVGGGWYTDGPGRNFDHYNGWALHLYTTLWALFACSRRSDAHTRLARYRDRLELFLTDFAPSFADNGAPMHHGRSLIYRHAALASIWLGAMVDATPLSPGATRLLCSRTLRYFDEHGAFEPDGVPSLGWFGAFPPMVQPYSGPGSPLWSNKGFLGLLMSADHPVWTSVEEEPAWVGRDEVRVLEPVGVLMGRSADGVVRWANHGADHEAFGSVSDPNYCRLTYTTHTGPAYTVAADGSGLPEAGRDGGSGRSREPGHARNREQRPDGGDQQVALWSRRGVSHRMGCVPIRVESTVPTVGSVHYPIWALDDPVDWRIFSVATFVGAVELRVHVLQRRPGLGTEQAQLVDGGAALPHASARPCPVPMAAMVTGAGLTAWSAGWHGWSQASVDDAAWATAYGDNARFPRLSATLTVAGGSAAVFVGGHAIGVHVPTPDMYPVRVMVGEVFVDATVTMGSAPDRAPCQWSVHVPIDGPWWPGHGE